MYSKTTWANGGAPAIDDTNLNKMEQGIADAHEFIDNLGLINHIGSPGGQGFGAGICPHISDIDGFAELGGARLRGADTYGNYIYQDGSIMVWVPRFYYRIAHASNPTYGTYGVNSIDIQPESAYADTAAANAAGYALHRAFIDGDAEKRGFFVDKYQTSKNAWGAGYIASSIKNGLPISTNSAHNPIADLTACAGNYYYEAITAAHARDGVDGAVNANSIFFCTSRFVYSALAMLALAHGQAARATTHCAWYDGTYNFPKGCNDNALGDTNDGTVSYATDGYSNCGKTGSGSPFDKTTHNGQACGIADLNGNMWEISIGLTCVAPAAAAIEAITSAATPVFTWTGHGLSPGDPVMCLSITQADWVNFKDKLWTVATTPDANTYTLTGAPDTSGYAAYVPGTDPGTMLKGAFYAAKQATAMADFTSGNSGATDHWGATGVAAMMDTFSPAFETGYSANGFSQRYGSGGNQVLDEATSGAGYLLAGLGIPKDADGIDATGVNLFGQDYFYQYIRNELCLRAGGYWNSGSLAGVFAAFWVYYRAYSYNGVGFRLACYPV